MEIIVASPRCTQESAKLLAESLSASYINPYSRYIGAHSEDIIINYGCTKHIGVYGHILNKVENVSLGIDKLKAFLSVTPFSVQIPAYTITKTKARKWLEDGDAVVIRETLTGSRNEGVTITNSFEDLETKPAVLYTRYIPHLYEIRINCFKDKLLSVLVKEDDGNGGWKFRLIKNGLHQKIQDMIKGVYSGIGLDIYGIDALVTVGDQLIFLEVNSGPVLFGQTLVRLTQAIKKWRKNAIA